MKKIIALTIAALMLLSIVACDTASNNEETTTNTEETTVGSTEETTVGGNEETTVGGGEETTVGGNEETTEAEVENNDAVIAPAVPENSWGYAFWTVFADSVKNNPQIATGEIVYNMLMSPAGQAIGMADNMDMVPGFLQGFSEEIHGFKSATVFAPFAAGFAFIGYVFELEADADVNAFVNMLDEKKDLRWMMCMTAETYALGAYNNYVMIVMSPEAMPGAGGADAAIVYPENAEDGTYAAEIWNFFEQAMTESAGAGAEEMAYAVAYSPVVPFMVADVNAVDMTVANEHFANGFDCIEAMFSVTETGSDVVIYLFSIENGLDPANWASWYVTGEGVVWGAYNNVLIAIHNANVYVQ